MNYIESAMENLDESTKPGLTQGERERLTRIAETQAAIVTAILLERIAVQLERLGDIVDVIAVNYNG